LISGPTIAPGRDPEKLVLLWRLADNCRGVERIPAARDLTDVKDRKLGGFRIVTEVIAKRALDASRFSRHDPFEYDLGIRGHAHVEGLRTHHGNALPS
jgi:hypothetical protein